MAFARTKNILHENPQLAENEGIKGIMLPGRSIIGRAEGEMTRLPEFLDCIMMLYGMDGDPEWGNRNTRFLGEVYVGEELEFKYIVSEKNKTMTMGYMRSILRLAELGIKNWLWCLGRIYRLRRR